MLKSDLSPRIYRPLPEFSDRQEIEKLLKSESIEDAITDINHYLKWHLAFKHKVN